MFHSVQRNLVAQTGDPDGNGKGGKSIFSLLYGEQAAFFEAETVPRIKHKKFGTLSMVNGGEGIHGSQFFLTLAPNIDYLDSQKHTVFGEVAEGFEVLNMFNEAIVDGSNQPYKDIRIFHTVVLDDPFEDPQGLEKYIPDRSPSPTAERLKGGRIGVDEEVDDEKGLTAEEVTQRHKEREAKANAQILEMVGDIPDVDVKPPDNVLFVCKLNPVTTSEDLEIIFSRFGPIASCEVIRDQKTKDSLQYAFIEFEKPEDCEKAYFKMDNVLIDDRRIHVDFSQSVSKIRWKPKGKPDAKKDDDEERTQLRIKHPDDRRVNKYNLVFEEVDTGVKHKRERSQSKDRHKHKKHHKKKKNRSSSSEHNLSSADEDVRRKMVDSRKDRKKSWRERSPISSNEQGKQKRRDTSSSEERTVQRHNKKHRSRSPSGETKRKTKEAHQGTSNQPDEKSKHKTKKRGHSSSEEERTKAKHKKKHHSQPVDRPKGREEKQQHSDSRMSREKPNKRH